MNRPARPYMPPSPERYTDCCPLSYHKGIPVFDSEFERGLFDLRRAKLAEIEKLAHSVKDKMSYSVRGPSIYQQFPYPVR